MIVVTGATGNIGQTLVTHLAQAGHTVTAISRGRTDSTAPTHTGVASVRADLTEVDSLSPALEGAEALFLLVPGAGEGVDGHALMATAAAAGVRKVVLLSSQAAGTRPGAASHAPLAALEDAVRSSGIEWTILRPSGFMSNTLAWVPSIRDRRVVFTPYADVALPVVDPTDIAAVAATVLTTAGHADRTYVLTGPRAVTPRECSAVIGAVLGTPVELVELTHGQAREQMTTVMPEAVVDGTLEILGHPTTEEQRVSTDIPDIIGRPAHSFADWATRHADAFR